MNFENYIISNHFELEGGFINIVCVWFIKNIVSIESFPQITNLILFTKFSLTNNCFKIHGAIVAIGVYLIMHEMQSICLDIALSRDQLTSNQLISCSN